MDQISSTQNKRIRRIKALQTKARLRRSEGLIVLQGDRLIADALGSGGRPAQALYTPEQADYTLIAKLQDRKCELLPVRQDVLRHVSETQQTPGILAVFHLPKPPIRAPEERILVFDGIREPGNLGTIMRTAAAADIGLAILAPGCADIYSPKALRAGMGAHFRLPVVEASWNEIGSFCRDLTVYAASAQGSIDYTLVDWRAAWALIIGNEAHGLSPKARSLTEHRISIPMSRATESLNVASAAAVILFEARRQSRCATGP